MPPARRRGGPYNSRLPMQKKPPTIGLTVAFLCAFALGACATVTTPTPSAKPTPTPATTSTVKQVAATAYLGAVTPLNSAARAALSPCAASNVTTAQLKACYGGAYTA